MRTAQVRDTAGMRAHLCLWRAVASSPSAPANAIRLAGMPNVFPSFHVATAFVLVLFAPGKVWRGVSLAFLAATALATLSAGEHYAIDLVAGLAFGCFAASVEYRNVRRSLGYLGVVLSWPLAVRFEYPFLFAHSGLLRWLAAVTVALAILEVLREWRIPAERAAEAATAPGVELHR